MSNKCTRYINTISFTLSTCPYKYCTTLPPSLDDDILTWNAALQIGSHYHFIEANPYLVFDRQRSHGMRLNILAGTAIRFEVFSLQVKNSILLLYPCSLKHTAKKIKKEKEMVGFVFRLTSMLWRSAWFSFDHFFW